MRKLQIRVLNNKKRLGHQQVNINAAAHVAWTIRWAYPAKQPLDIKTFRKQQLRFTKPLYFNYLIDKVGAFETPCCRAPNATNLGYSSPLRQQGTRFRQNRGCIFTVASEQEQDLHYLGIHVNAKL